MIYYLVFYLRFWWFLWLDFVFIWCEIIVIIDDLDWLLFIIHILFIVSSISVVLIVSCLRHPVILSVVSIQTLNLTIIKFVFLRWFEIIFLIHNLNNLLLLPELLLIRFSLLIRVKAGLKLRLILTSNRSESFLCLVIRFGIPLKWNKIRNFLSFSDNWVAFVMSFCVFCLTAILFSLQMWMYASAWTGVKRLSHWTQRW